MQNPDFERLLEEMRALHQRKNEDYAREDDPLSNFRFAAWLAEGFADPLDRTFATLLGVKLARIQQLTCPGAGAPNFESLADSFRDLATYAAIWAAERTK